MLSYLRSGLTTVRIAICLTLASLTGSLHAEVKICGRKEGQLITEFEQKHNQGAITLARAFARGGTWVYIRKLTTHQANIVLNGEIQNVDGLGMLSSKSEKDVDSNGMIAAMRSDSHDPQFWFIQSNHGGLGSSGRSLTDGLALVVHGEEDPFGQPGALRHEDVFKSTPVLQLKQLHPDFVIIDTDSQIDQTPFDPNESLVLTINSSVQEKTPDDQLNILASLWAATPNSVSIMNMMPTSKEEALKWNLSELDAEAYAGAGLGFISDLDKYGYTPNSTEPQNTVDFQAEIVKQSKHGKLVVVIGESGDQGGSLRIPGTNNTIDVKQAISSLPHKARILGLFCNSHQSLIDVNAASFVGTIYSDKSSKLLRVVLDKREPGSVSEYLAASSNVDRSLSVNVKDVSPQNLLNIIGALAGQLQLHPDSKGFPLLSFPLPMNPASYTASISQTPRHDVPVQQTTTPPVDPTRNNNDSDPSGTPNYWLCFLTGLLGGLCREFLRWRRLRQSKRHDLYLKPLYFAISLIEIILGALVALVFVNLSPTRKTDLVISFVAGAAFEFIVKLAMQGKIWTPKVPQAEGVTRAPSVYEYLRS